MARIEITSAFVEPWTKNSDQHPEWGMKIAEPHSRKKEGGGYETVSRTFYTVKAGSKEGINLTNFVKGDRVAIVGDLVTEMRERDGKKYYDLVVWVRHIKALQSGGGGQGASSGGYTGQGSPQAGNAPQNDGWAAPGQSFTDPNSAPF